MNFHHTIMWTYFLHFIHNTIYESGILPVGFIQEMKKKATDACWCIFKLEFAMCLIRAFIRIIFWHLRTFECWGWERNLRKLRISDRFFYWILERFCGQMWWKGYYVPLEFLWSMGLCAVEEKRFRMRGYLK